MIYRLHGKEIPRDAYQQAEIGTTLSFIDESEVGDLAFFDNNEGEIIHRNYTRITSSFTLRERFA